MSFGTPVGGAIAYSSSGGATVSPAYPAGVLATDVIVMVVGRKPSVANAGDINTPSGWTSRGSWSGGGYGSTLGADQGNTQLRIFTKDVVTAGLSGNVSVSLTSNNIAWAQIIRVPRPVAVNPVSFNVGFNSRDTAPTANVEFSVTLIRDNSTTFTFTNGDAFLWAMCIPTDVSTPSQFSAQSVSVSFMTFGATTELGEPDSQTGNDIGGYIAYSQITANTSGLPSWSENPSVRATAGGTTTNVRGPIVLLRLRDVQLLTLDATPNQTFALTGNEAFFERTRVLAAEKGTFSLVGKTTALSGKYALVTESRAFSVDSFETLRRQTAYRLLADPAVFKVNGVVPGPQGEIGGHEVDATELLGDVFKAGNLLLCDTQAFTVGLKDTTFSKTYSLVAAAGAFALAGTATTFSRGKGPLDASPSRAIAVTGNAAGLARSYRLLADVVSYTVSRFDAVLRRGYAINASPNREIAVTGFDAGLLRKYAINASPNQAIAVTGFDAGVLRKYTLNASPNRAVAVTVFDASVLRARTLNASPNRAISVGTTATDFLRGYVVSAAPNRVVSVTGFGAGLLIAHRLNATPNRAISVTGFGVNVLRSFTLNASPNRTAAVVGFDASIRAARRLVADVTAYALTGFAVTLIRVRVFTLTADRGIFALSGNATNFLRSYVVNATPNQAVAVTRFAASVVRQYTLNATPNRAVVVTSNAANLLRSLRLAAEKGTFTVSGIPNTAVQAHVLAADTRLIAVTRNAANLLRSLRLVADVAAASVVGNAANLRRTFTLAATVDLVAVTGSATSVYKASILNAGPNRTYDFTGNAAGFVRALRVNAAPNRAVAVSGSAANLLRTRRLAAEVTAFSVAGTTTGLLRAVRLAADTVAYSATGNAAVLLRGFSLAANLRTYSIIGAAAALSATRQFYAQAAAISVTGFSVDLARAGLRLLPQPGAFAHVGSSVALVRDLRLPVLAEQLDVTGQETSLLRWLVAGTGGFDTSGYVDGGYVDPNYVSLAADVRVSRYLPATTGTVLVAGYTGGLSSDKQLLADPASVLVSGSDATVRVDRALILLAESGALSLTGTQVTLVTGVLLSPQVGQLSVAQQPVSLLVDRQIQLGSGTYTLSGYDSGSSTNVILYPETGQFAVSASDLDFIEGLALVAGTGVVSVDTAGTQFVRAVVLVAQTGSFVVTPESAEVNFGISFGGEPGVFTASGADVAFRRTYVLHADLAAVQVVGTSTQVLASRKLYLDSAAFNLAAGLAGIFRSATLLAGTGVFLSVGQGAEVRRSATVLYADLGSFVAAAETAALIRRLRLQADTSSVASTSSVAQLLYGRAVALLLGEFDLTGYSISGRFSSLPDAYDDAVRLFESRDFDRSLENRTAVRPLEIRGVIRPPEARGVVRPEEDLVADFA